jgi:hypothetical protein
MSDRLPKALQRVSAQRRCDGCGHPFEPRRRDQRHCRPTCRGLALQARRRLPLFEDRDALARSPYE